jgi:hypothetical protein
LRIGGFGIVGFSVIWAVSRVCGLRILDWRHILWNCHCAGYRVQFGVYCLYCCRFYGHLSRASSAMLLWPFSWEPQDARLQSGYGLLVHRFCVLV